MVYILEHCSNSKKKINPIFAVCFGQEGGGESKILPNILNLSSIKIYIANISLNVF